MMLFGAYVQTGMLSCTAPTHREALLAFESCLGRKLDTDRVYYRWNSEFPLWELSDLLDGHTPHISFRPITIKNQPVCWADIANGLQDYRIKQIAQALNPIAFISPKPLFITFNHEADNDRNGGYSKYNLGEPNEFRAAWQRFFSILLQEDVFNIKRILVLDHWVYNTAEQWNPGSEWVDGWGVDGFNRPKIDGEWKQPKQLFTPALKYAKSQGKPLYVTEFGSDASDKDLNRRARWIKRMGLWLKENSDDIALAQYWNGLDYRLNEDQAALEALKVIGL